jgi:hypothetical protein
MHRNASLLAVGLILLVVGFLLSPALFAQGTNQLDGSSPQQWEYRVLPMSEVAGKGGETEQAKRVESKFNELGSDGWEFVQIHLRVAVFKRPKH